MNAIIFPGQGAQYRGMGKDLWDNYPQVKELYALADKILGIKISAICFEGSDTDLKNTYFQQLAILTTSLAAYRVFSDKKLNINILSGLSLGEYSCLYPAQVLSLESLLTLVKERALAMESAAKSNPSTMLAVIGADRDKLGQLAKTDGFYVANINSPQQIVVSLKKSDLEKVKVSLASLNAKVIELDVSGGFHSPFMEPAKKHLQSVLDKLEFNDAIIPIVSNFTAKPSSNKQEIKNNLLEQLVSSVLWCDCVEYIVKNGVNLFYEIGPSRVLRGLMRKINSEIKVINIEKKEDLNG